MTHSGPNARGLLIGTLSFLVTALAIAGRAGLVA